jgi:formate dehydrogenase iron-sulfur subunit
MGANPTGVRVFVPRDATACALGADAVAAAIADHAGSPAAGAAPKLEVIRNGSRGAFWLEPLVEVETADGRMAFGPVGAGDVPGLFEAGFPDAADHPLALGPIDDIDWLASQQRLTFARAGRADPLSLDDYRALGGYAGLERALGMSRRRSSTR